MTKRITSVCLLVFLISVAPTAKPSEVVKTSKGEVEFIGLETWTPKMIEEKLGYKSPDQLHYCAADLKRIGFPEAAVMGYMDHGKRYTIVTVIEPEYAHDVAFLPAPPQRITPPPSWQSLLSAVQQPNFLEGGVLDYARALPGAGSDRQPLSDGTPQVWWTVLHKFAGPADYTNARKILRADADPSARAAAALVLMNFSRYDAAWQDLVRGLRDPDVKVNATCLQALNSLSTFLPRKVDWTPSLPDIVPLLRGTNLFAFVFLLKALAATGVNQSLAGPLLSRGNARLVIAYLNAAHPEEHDLAHSFLVQLHGADLGAEPEPWLEWIASIGKTR
jgi:hypothetical protein